VKKPTLPEQIANQLRRKILLGELPAGSSLKERDNAAVLGVSRTPMREATRILAQEGLVILRPSRSPIVADPSLKEVTDDLIVMGALEVLSGELACQNATDDEIRHISELHEELAQIAHSREPIDTFEIDMQFHREIAAASHNPALAETHKAYLARLWRVRFLSASMISNWTRSNNQHVRIVQGLQKRDADLVAREIRSHMDQLVTNISHLFAKRDAEHVA
jgi:DNA-binding GntR family transcriptional regulator